MELLGELEPVKSREKLEKRARLLAELADWIDIPDSPLGTTRFFSPLVSCALKMVLRDVGVIAHIRVIDLNMFALESITRTLDVCGVERVVPLRGDIVPGYKLVDELSPETAVSTIRKLGVRLSPGLLLSLRKTSSEIEERLRANADFYLVLNLTRETLDKLKAVSEKARASGKKLYPYIIVARDKQSTHIPRELASKSITLEEAIEVVGELSGYVDGVLVSSPGDFDLLVESLKTLRRRS